MEEEINIEETKPHFDSARILRKLIDLRNRESSQEENV